MAYVPNNLEIFCAAFAGVMGGLGGGTRTPTDSLSADEAPLAAMALNFAEAVDTVWGVTASDSYQNDAIAEICAATWDGRAQPPTATSVAALTPWAQGLVASVQAGSTILAAQGIVPPPPVLGGTLQGTGSVTVNGDHAVHAITGALVVAATAPTGSGVVHVTAGTTDAAASKGTANQYLVTNGAATDTAWATAAGDWTGAVTANAVGKLTGIGGVLAAATTAAVLTWAEASLVPGLTLAARTSDSVCANMMLTPQAPFAGATGANRAPGNVVVNCPAPTGGGSVYGQFVVWSDFGGGGNAIYIGRNFVDNLSGIYVVGVGTFTATGNATYGSRAGTTTIQAAGGSPVLFALSGVGIMRVENPGVQYGVTIGSNAGTYGTGTNVLCIQDATAPTTDPTTSVLLYSDSVTLGGLGVRTTAGRTLALGAQVIFDKASTVAGIGQFARTAAGDGAKFTVQAQDANGAAQVGGALALLGGTPGAGGTHGLVYIGGSIYTSATLTLDTSNRTLSWLGTTLAPTWTQADAAVATPGNTMSVTAQRGNGAGQAGGDLNLNGGGVLNGSTSGNVVVASIGGIAKLGNVGAGSVRIMTPATTSAGGAGVATFVATTGNAGQPVGTAITEWIAISTSTGAVRYIPVWT